MPSPLLGYNTNVRHHGKVFHIQTEDSGVSHGHIFTHLFADGGRIVATRKTSYQQHLGTTRFPAVVKGLMKAQHKAMFIALRDGLFDEDELAGAREFALREITVDDDPAQVAEVKSAPVDVDALDRAAASFEPSTPGVDAENFEAAAASYEGGGFGDVLPDVPAETAHGVTSPGLESPAGMTSSPGLTPSVPVSATFSAPDPSTSSRPPSAGRYSVTAPVASRPKPPKDAGPRPKDSLFGHDLLSEKSLDEVILSYLADDLDEKK